MIIRTTGWLPPDLNEARSAAVRLDSCSADGLVMTALPGRARGKEWCVCLVRETHGMIAAAESGPWPRQLIPLLCIPTLR